jgi:GNAT superfamily N-acetyltransferase
MEGLTIRDATEADATALSRVWTEGGTYYAALDPRRFRVPNEEGLIEWMRQSLAKERDEDEAWLVAELAGAVVGDISARIERPHLDAKWQVMRDLGESVLQVDSLMVREDRRRRGVGTALMRAVEAWGRRRAATVVFLTTYHLSPASVPFYEKRMGYERTSIGFWSPLYTLRCRHVPLA